MWALLQFISGSIQRNPVSPNVFFAFNKLHILTNSSFPSFQLSNFMSVLSLYDVLYPEKEPLPVPDCTKTYATRQVISIPPNTIAQIA